MLYGLLSAGLAVTLAAILPAPAHAQTVDHSEEAKEQFQEGREALKQGDCARALTLFRKSYELYPKPATLINIAHCEEKVGLIASAWRHFLEVAPQFPATDERAQIAQARAVELEPRVPQLRIDLTPGAPRGTSVTCDGVAVAAASFGKALPMEPGKHVLVVTSPDRFESRREVTLLEGQRQTIAIGPGKEIREPASQATRADVPPKSNPARTAGFVMGGIGLAGLVVGGVTGILVINKMNQAEEMCPVPTQCTPEGMAIERSGRALSIVSTVSFGVGIAGAGVGAYLILSSTSGGGDQPPSSASLGPVMLPGGVGLGAFGIF